MRLPARLQSLGGRRLGRAGLVVVALAGAGTAVGVGADSSPPRQAAKPPIRPAGPAPTARAGPGWPATAARKRAAERRPRRGGADYYRRTARKEVPAKIGKSFLPLYREAGRVFGVNWRLIASIHRQETAFSTEPSTYRGLNAFGCCAGPMQFNVKNGPPSTWESYRNAYRAGKRPKRYPHPTRSHPSVYDDFDAIMAAGSLLSDSGAGRSLDRSAWRAAYSYYGHDLFGVTYASEVLARAVAWQRDGFCLNCALDDGLVAELDGAYGASVRRQLLAAERRRKKREERSDGRDRRRDDRRDRRRSPRRGDRDSVDRAPVRSPAPRRRPSRPPSAEQDPPPRPSSPPKPSSPPPSTSTEPSPTPSPAQPAPPAGECPSVKDLLGC